MKQQQPAGPELVEPEMVVETTDGDLGEQDITKPKVTDVVRDRKGRVKRVVVEKGKVFRKHIEVPAERIRSVAPEPAKDEPQGEVTIATSEQEVDALAAVGTDKLTPKRVEPPQSKDVLEQVEEELPTAEGMRRREASNATHRRKRRARPTKWTTHDERTHGAASATESTAATGTETATGTVTAPRSHGLRMACGRCCGPSGRAFWPAWPATTRRRSPRTRSTVPRMGTASSG